MDGEERERKISKIVETFRGEEDIDRYKKKIAEEIGSNKILKNSEILKYVKEEKIREALRKKPSRTMSGVTVVAVMTSPVECPHGRCVMCPGGPTNNSPQSYTGFEPAAMRGAQCGYDPYRQVKQRLEQLRAIGHPIGKVELIVMGGTFTARPFSYQRSFVSECLGAMNEFYDRGHSNSNDSYSKSKKSSIFEDVKRINETAKVRNIGTTFETRPDYCKRDDIDDILYLGGTKVEIGVQSIYNGVLEKIRRGHTVEDSIEANRALRDSGLKVGFHVMPGLPSSDLDSDLCMFKELFEGNNFKPDHLKIYPTLVAEGTELYEWWKAGIYEPYRTEEAAELIADIKKIVPPWVRIQRIQRDIPSNHIIDGVKKSNVRQIAQNILRKRGERCRCIRCREVGHARDEPKDIDLSVRKYYCCGGEEFFISYEDLKNDILIGFIRMRFPFRPHRKEINEDTALIRELHVYGQMLDVGKKPEEISWHAKMEHFHATKSKISWQHRNYGRLLLRDAEDIARENGFKKMAVCSGIGAREYYRKFDYELDGVYMSKTL